METSRESRDKIRQLYTFLSLPLSEQRSEILAEYQRRAPHETADVRAQVQWHVEMLEEQLSQLSPQLFATPSQQYSLSDLASSTAFTVAIEVDRYVRPLLAKLPHSYVSDLWREFSSLLSAVVSSQESHASGLRAYRLLYLASFAIGQLLDVTAVRNKGLTKEQLTEIGTTITDSDPMQFLSNDDIDHLMWCLDAETKSLTN